MDEQSLEALQACTLFEGMSKEETFKLLHCLAAAEKTCRKGEVIFASGISPQHIGVVLQGQLHVEQNDYWGNRAILAQLGRGDLFGEAFCFAGTKKLPVDVVVVKAGKILLIDHTKITNQCQNACVFHAGLIQNMLRVLAQKNVALTGKVETVTQRTTKNKLLAYLSAEARRQGGQTFTIPFNRQELADYLSVDRSAMSAELSKMQKEGLLTFYKNVFTLK